MRELSQTFTPNGLSRDRIASGILSEAQIQNLVDEAEDGRLRFDQSSFSCLLVEVMAAESCRKIIILLESCGFLKRIGSNNIRIKSEGKLEALYREHLRTIYSRIANSV